MQGFYVRRLGWEIDLDQVRLVTDVMVGAKELILSCTEPGDGVIVCPPAYPPYFADVAHLGRKVMRVPLLKDYGLDWRRLDHAFANGAKALLLCNPHNPTGRVYTREELTPIASLADAYGALVIADEIHAPLTLPGNEFVPWTTVAEHGVALTSASKAFNTTALKLAFVVGEPATELPEELQYHAGHLGVLAAEAAFREGDEWLDATLATIAANHAALPGLLPEGISVAHPPQAGYLTWLDCRALELDEDPAYRFYERGRVALEPGPRFGSPGFARLNVGTTPETVAEAVRRMAAALTP